MDGQKPQAAHLPEAGYLHYARTGAVDGMSVSRENLEPTGVTPAGAKCYPVRPVALPGTEWKQPGASVPFSQKGKHLDEGTRRRKEPENKNEDEGVVLDRFGRSESEIRFKSLLGRLHDVEFSWTLSVKLLGGEKRLKSLLMKGKIHATKKSGAANTMWRFNAAEVVAYVKPDKKFL